jgi:hypothetical protein
MLEVEETPETKKRERAGRWDVKYASLIGVAGFKASAPQICPQQFKSESQALRGRT